jgi:hypothetical protein
MCKYKVIRWDKGAINLPKLCNLWMAQAVNLPLAAFKKIES